MRLIDAVAYRKVLEEEKDYQLEHCFDSLKVRMGLEIAEADLGDMPTVDAVPVVRCRECIHRTEHGNCGHPRHEDTLPTAYPNDFCSYGKRKEASK